MFTYKEVTLDTHLDWGSLVKLSKSSTFFQQQQWLQIWVNHFLIDHKIIAVFEDARLIGLAPISENLGTISLLGTSPVLGKEQVCDFGDIICLPGQEKNMWSTILEYLSKRHAGKTFVPNFIRENSPSYAILQSLDSNPTVSATSPYLDLPVSWDDYLNGLKRKNRHELKRKLKKLDPVKYQVYRSDSDKTSQQKFIQLMKQSSPEKTAFLSQPMEDFFVDFLTTFDKEQIFLWFMDVEEKTVAGALAFQFHDELLLYNSGINLTYGHLSVGVLSIALLIKYCIEHHLKRFDFLQGDERYKYNLGGVDNKLYQFKINL